MQKIILALLVSLFLSGFQQLDEWIPGQLTMANEQIRFAGYYRLKLDKDFPYEYCLEGNLGDPATQAGGRPLLVRCGKADGQFWRFVETDPGEYILTTRFAEQKDKCLDHGLDGIPDSPWQLIMKQCNNPATQRWKFHELLNTGKFAIIPVLPSDASTSCLIGDETGSDQPIGGGASIELCEYIVSDRSRGVWEILLSR